MGCLRSNYIARLLDVFESISVFFFVHFNPHDILKADVTDYFNS